ncbi:hypothetical protein [Mucilaginibacter pineti]|uniref:hypothetical protein n=1 Tax=Mucilaginibacter pineti TaxID=1391627 RepID=UPI000B842E19|nr:hypothetical protein [Mucilaginibacter pineti]
MLVAILKIFIFLCVIIIPLRGPSRRKEDNVSHARQSKTYSKYAVNENGGLEVLEDNKAGDR